MTFRRDFINMETVSDRAFTVGQAAEYLGICKKTAYRLIRDRQLEAYPITRDRIRPTYRVRKSSADKYIRDQRQTLAI